MMPGIEICTVKKTMERRTSCLAIAEQCRLPWKKNHEPGCARSAEEADAKSLDAAAMRAQIEALKGTVATLQFPDLILANRIFSLTPVRCALGDAGPKAWPQERVQPLESGGGFFFVTCSRMSSLALISAERCSARIRRDSGPDIH